MNYTNIQASKRISEKTWVYEWMVRQHTMDNTEKAEVLSVFFTFPFSQWKPTSVHVVEWLGKNTLQPSVGCGRFETLKNVRFVQIHRSG